MVTMTEQQTRADWWLRAQVFVTAVAVAIEAAATLSTLWQRSGQIPVTVLCFVATVSPILVPRASQFRAACLVIGNILLLVGLFGLLWLWIYALMYVTPVLVAGCALVGTGTAVRAEQRTGPVPVVDRVVLLIVAVSAGAALAETALLSPSWHQTPIGVAGWGALALLPLVFRDRHRFRVAGLVAGVGLVLVYLSQPSATPVLAGGVAVVLVCSGGPRSTRGMALTAIGISWLVPLLQLVYRN